QDESHRALRVALRRCGIGMECGQDRGGGECDQWSDDGTPHWLACLRCMPVSLAITASLSFSALMLAANCLGPRTLHAWPVATKGFAMPGLSLTTARMSAAICSRSASGMPRGPNTPPGLSISMAG